MFNKIRKLIFTLLAALIFGVLLISPIMAQDEVSDASPPTVTESNVPDGSVVLSVWQLLAVALAFFLSGGAISVGGLGYLADKIRNDPVAMKNAENVGNSIPADTANKLIDLADSATKIATFMKEALDRVPAASKAEQRE